MTNSDKGSLILLDEADNILNTHLSWFMRGETQDKGWLNQILEEPGTRMIWITNSIDGVEESVLRRFAYSLCFKPFNRKQRIRLWNSVLKNNKAKLLMSDTDIANLSGRYKISSGAMDIAVKKAVEKSTKSKKKFSRSIDDQCRIFFSTALIYLSFPNFLKIFRASEYLLCASSRSFR